MSDRVLPIVVIYRNPLDYPLKFVVRRQWACQGGAVEIESQPLAVVDTIDEARAAVPSESDTRMDRDPADDPTIFEVWL